jgi:hypothetical protein
VNKKMVNKKFLSVDKKMVNKKFLSVERKMMNSQLREKYVVNEKHMF